MNFTWYFPPLMGGNDNDSANGSGIDLFTTDPLGNLGREIIQNSLDARSGSDPVIVEFEEFETPSSASIPGKAELENHIEKWLRGNPPDETISVDHELLFHKRAFNSLKSTEPILWLRASDFNTKGLSGFEEPDNNKKPWYLFVKANGQNAKGAQSGGSKGLGKNAIFANSDIHTLFVETLVEGKRAATGIAKLSSIEENPETPSPEKKRGVGYLVREGVEYAPPIYGELQLQPGYSRNQDGTDLYIPCFSYEEDWVKQIITEALFSFLPAFNDGDLELRVKTRSGERYEINRENLNKAIWNDNYILKKKARDLRLYWGVLTSEKTIKKCFTSKPGFEMTLLVRGNANEYTNRILAFRYSTKMRVCAVPNVSSYTNFTGVLLVEGKEICARLRSLEDATHSKWSPTKWKDTGYTKEQIEEATSTYNRFVSDFMANFGIRKDTEESDFEWAKNEGFTSQQNDPEFYGTTFGEDGLPSRDFSFLRDKNKKADRKKKPLKRRGTVADEDGDASAFVDAEGVLLDQSPEESPSDIVSPPLPIPGQPLGPNNPDSEFDGSEIDNSDRQDEEDVSSSKNKEGSKKVRKAISTAFCKMPAQDPLIGHYVLVFSPRRSGKNVTIEILQAGSGKMNESLTITKATEEDKELTSKGNCFFMDEIVQGQKYLIDLSTDVKRNCVWEVNIYADA